MLMLKDASLYEIIGFLDSADQHGHSIPTQIGPQVWRYLPNGSSLWCASAVLENFASWDDLKGKSSALVPNQIECQTFFEITLSQSKHVNAHSAYY